MWKYSDKEIAKLQNGHALLEIRNNIDKLLPLTGIDYAGEVNVSTNYEVYYNEYTTNKAETPTVSALPLVGAIARIVFNAGASASLVATNLGTARPNNDSFLASKLNEITVYSLPEGLSYSIKVLN